MKRAAKRETPKDACRTTRSHIARLSKMLETELNAPGMQEDTWPVAGSLGYIRQQLAEAVGHLKNTEGDELVDALTRKNR